MASISGSVTIAGDPDDWIACAFDAATHAYAGVAAVASGTYSISGLTAGRAYVVACRPKTGAVWQASSYAYLPSSICIPTDPETTPYIFKATDIELADQYFDNVSILLPLTEINGATTFVDVIGNTITRSGNVVASNAQSKWASTSAYFDGNSDYLDLGNLASLALNGDFTIEMWIYPTAAQEMRLFTISGGAYSLSLRFESDMKIRSFSTPDIKGTTVCSTNAWHHVAVTRSGTTTRIFLDGAQENSGTATAVTLDGSTNRVSESVYSILGYVNDVRVTKGVARYTEAFSVPASAFPIAGGLGTDSTEPTWPTTPGQTVVDGGVTWTNMGQLLDPLIVGPLIAV